jgi:putative ABC transport system permease protein
MQFRDIFNLAQRALKGNQLRSNLTVAIIAIGITALIGIITVIEVLKGTIETSFAGMGSNTFTITEPSVRSNVKKHGKKKRMNVSDANERIKLLDGERFQENFQFPSRVSLSMMVNSGATVKRGKKKSNPNINVVATDEHYLKVSGTNLDAGRNFTVNEVASGSNTCLVGQAIGKKYFGKVADAVNGILQIGSVNYRVLGVMESKGSSFINRADNMVVITLNNAKKRYNLAQLSCSINVQVKDIKYMDLASDEAEGLMRQIRRVKLNEESNFAINHNNDIANSLLENTKFVTLAASIIGLITLLGAAIGLMNIMLVSVAERTREIGLTKAIGANAATIRAQFLTEALIISLKGGFIGIVVGIVIGNVLTLVLGTSFVIPWMWIGVGLSLCILVGLLAGIYPALKASKLNPINALRYE